MAAPPQILLSVEKINALQELRKDFLCQICGEIFEEPMMPSTGCDHKYCYTCIYDHFRFGNSCPICKLPLVPKDLRSCHKLGEILNEFKTLNDMYAIIQRCTSAAGDMSTGTGDSKKCGKQGQLQPSSDSAKMDNALSTPASNNGNEQFENVDGVENLVVGKQHQDDSIVKSDNEKSLSQASANVMDNETTGGCNRREEDGSLSVSQNNMDLSQSINLSYAVPISNVDHVKGSLEYDNEDYYRDNKTRASSLVIEETIGMEETANDSEADITSPFLKADNSNCTKANTEKQAVNTDEECSSSSSDSDSDGDDLIDLDQLKQQIEKEERELKELQTRTSGKTSDVGLRTKKTAERASEKANGGVRELRVVDGNVPRQQKRQRSPQKKNYGSDDMDMLEEKRSHKKAKSCAGSSSAITQQSFCKEAVLVMSMLSQHEKHQVKQFLSKPWALNYKVRLEENVDVNTTHIITKVVKKDRRTGALQCRRTMKYFHGVAVQAWILSADWITQCLKKDKWLDEEKFEIVCGDKDPSPQMRFISSRRSKLAMGGARKSRLKRFPSKNFDSLVDFNTSSRNSLLNGYNICVWHDFADVRLERDQVVKLCSLSGAKVVSADTLPKAQEAHDCCIDSDVEQWPKKTVLVCPQQGMPLDAAKSYEQKYNIYVVNHTWLLDTVSQNDIKNPLNEHFSFTRLGRDIEY